MLIEDSFCQQMHVLPVHTWFENFFHSLLSFINSNINLFLLVSKFSINRERDCLISTISVPFSSHIMKGHFSRLIDFIILNVMKCGTISSTWADGMKTCFGAASFMCMFKLKDTLQLNLLKPCSGWFKSWNMSLCADSTHVSHDINLIFSFNDSEVGNCNPKSLFINRRNMIPIFFLRKSHINSWVRVHSKVQINLLEIQRLNIGFYFVRIKDLFSFTVLKE